VPPPQEERRGLRRQQGGGGADSQLTRAGSVPERAIPDLVVVLRAEDEPLGRRALELPREVGDRRFVVGVVALVLMREEDMEDVVELVGPLGVEAPLLDRAQVS